MNSSPAAIASICPVNCATPCSNARKAGHADIEDTLTVGVSGVGCRFEASASTLAAISFGAISSRLTPTRRTQMAQLLQEQLALHLQGGRG